MSSNKPNKGKKTVLMKRTYVEEEDDEDKKILETKDAKKTRTFAPTKVKFEREGSSSSSKEEAFPPDLEIYKVQIGNLSKTELLEIFATCSPDPTVIAHQQIQLALEQQLYEKDTTKQNLTQQRPLHTSDCPICYESLKFKKNRSPIIFCKTCGNNVHEVSDYK
ncbi:hypothetical protein BDC45DRAFT_113007 [Circinella umbellata]|nr:hypothetical protein BDC45DRAFT_113007 [Circinella umbellata]